MISEGIVISNNQILLVKQKTQSGKIVWNFPGGHVDPGETYEEAVVREVKEETGYDVLVDRFLFQWKINDNHKFFICSLKNAQNKNIHKIEDDDILEVKWVSLNDEKYFDDKTRRIIELLK